MAPCGPFSTSICVMPLSSWLSAFGFVCSTPSTTSAKFVSASRPVLMPRITTCMSPASAVCTCETFGVSSMKSVGRSMPADAMSASVKARTVAGTSSIRSARWRAVTTTSGSSPGADCAAASARSQYRRDREPEDRRLASEQRHGNPRRCIQIGRERSYSQAEQGGNIGIGQGYGIHGERQDRVSARTLFEKIWRPTRSCRRPPKRPAVIAVDLHLTHEVTSPQAFALLEVARACAVRRPERTRRDARPRRADRPRPGVRRRADPARVGARQIGELERNAREHGFELLGLGDARRGIVHVIGPELGLTQPGMTIVCGDSHTSTHGAFGTLAFGIGTTEVAHVLATQCLLQRKPKTLAITVEGALGAGVGAKDLVLAIIGRIGVAGGARQVIEYRGATIRALSMDERMTVCNMSIEAGARAGMIAPDETTFAYLRGRPRAPAGEEFERAVERWRGLAAMRARPSIAKWRWTRRRSNR